MEVGRIQQAFPEVETLLTSILIQWLGQEEPRVRKLSWDGKIKQARTCSASLDAEKATNLEPWLALNDLLRMERNLLAHGALARVMIGPDEEEKDEDADRVAVVIDRGGSTEVHYRSKAEVVGLLALIEAARNMGLALLATALKSTSLPASPAGPRR